jgi:four helix bundle protein
MIKRFEDLTVWRKAHGLVLKIYVMTRNFPADEKFGLVPQMRRCAVSIAANIAEGFKKRTIREKSSFYNVSQGSLEELRYYLILSRDLSYIDEVQELLDLIDEVARMLHGLIDSMNK